MGRDTRFKKGNTEWKKSSGVIRNMGRLTSEIVKSPEFEAAKKKGNERYHARESLKKDIFKTMTDENGIEKGVKKILKKAEKGDTKQFVDLIKIIAPNELDITSNGNTVSMDNVLLNGKELDLEIGTKVTKKDEE